ncbi:MAG: IPT/TIG domain-containing protein [Acidobacteria bacterium]|nr:IPT/TIG domain-containing protein [Acidobacteriota bacterium]
MKAAAVVTAVIVSGVFFVPRSRAEWTRLETGPEESNPRRRQSHAMALNHASGRILLFGGWNDQVGLLDDTWEWDGNGWRRMLPRTVPPARSMHAMAFDSATGKILMFGGMTNIGLRQNDTWSWDGADWTRVATATLPPERSGHVMALDPSTNAIIMFGGHGRDPGSFLNDTWTYRDENWLELRPVHSPSARGNPALATTLFNALALFGGYEAQELGDTWTWNGSDWNLAQSSGPSPRDSHVMFFDRQTNQLVCHGGWGANPPPLADTWFWYGGTEGWTRFSDPGALGGRTSAAAVGLLGGGGLLFGGYDPAVDRGSWETWKWTCDVPTITAQPQSAEVLSGQSALLAVGAVGTGVLNYQWYEGDNSGSSILIPGANAATYATPPLTTTHSYHVELENECGLTSSLRATVSIASSCVAPSIVEQPSSLTVLAGMTATLSVTASGSSIRFQWYEGIDYNSSILVPGAVTNVLVTPQLARSTSYWVRASNECGVADSTIASVTVGGGSGGPAITSVVSKTGKPGSTAIINGNGFGRAPKLNVAYFDQSRAKVTKASSTKLKVKIPRKLKSNMVVSVVVWVGGARSNALLFQIR